MTEPTRFAAEDYEAMCAPYMVALLAATGMGTETASDLVAMLRQATETEREMETSTSGDAFHYAQEELKTLRIMVGHFGEGHRQADAEIVRLKTERDTLQAEVERLTEKVNELRGEWESSVCREQGTFIELKERRAEVERLTKERDTLKRVLKAAQDEAEAAHQGAVNALVARDEARSIVETWLYFWTTSLMSNAHSHNRSDVQ